MDKHNVNFSFENSNTTEETLDLLVEVIVEAINRKAQTEVTPS